MKNKKNLILAKRKENHKRTSVIYKANTAKESFSHLLRFCEPGNLSALYEDEAVPETD